MLLTITFFELSSGQTYKQNEPDNWPDIRPDDRIGFKLLPLLQNSIIHISRKFHAHRLKTKEVYPKPDIRLDDRIKFKLYPVLQNNIIHTSSKFNANRLNIKKVYPAGYADHHQNQ